MTRTLALLCRLLAAMVAAAPAAVGQPSAPLHSTLRALTADAADPALAAPGVAVAMVDRRGRVSARAAGCARFAPDGRTCGRAMTAYTLVRIASISKLVMALTAVQLADAGRLDLDQDVSQALGFPLHHPAYPGQAIMLRRLLSHTAGLSDAAGYAIPVGHALADYLVPGAAQYDDRRFASAAPGARYAYANLGSPIVAQTLEGVSGTRFDRLARARVLAPLGIDAGYNFAGIVDRDQPVATLYRKRTEKGVWRPKGPWVPQLDDRQAMPARPLVYTGEGFAPLAADAGEAAAPGVNGGLFAPQGGLRLSVAQLARLGPLFMDHAGGDRPPDLVAAARAMAQPHWLHKTRGPPGTVTDGVIFGYGMGLQLGTGRAADSPLSDERLRWVGHLGWAYGLVSGLIVQPQEGWAVAYAVTGTAAAYTGDGFTPVERAVLDAAIATVRARKD